jgi:uncharacterized membrane protein
MSDFSCSCGCRWSCAAVAVVISVILGVIAAFLQFAGVIAVAATLLGVVFAVAVGYLAVLLVLFFALLLTGTAWSSASAAANDKEKCGTHSGAAKIFICRDRRCRNRRR